MRRKYIALIPAFEPDERILKLADELIKKGVDILVVDDGSGPSYRALFNDLSQRAIVLTHSNNLGKGAALRTGLRFINKYMAYTESILTPSGAMTVSGGHAGHGSGSERSVSDIVYIGY